MRHWSVILIGIGVFMLFCAMAGRILVVDAPEKSDVILILAGETDHRLERGLQLLDQGYGHVLVIDVPAGAKVYGFTEVELARRYAAGLPESSAVRICPIQGLSTKDEAKDAEKCLNQEKGNRVLIVTSDFHTRRAASIFRHEMGDKAFSLAAAYDRTQFDTRWWGRRQWAKTFVDEWLRLLWWNGIDRWR